MTILCLEPEFVLVSACKRSILSKHSVRLDDNKLQNAQMHMLKTVMSQEDTHETLKFVANQISLVPLSDFAHWGNMVTKKSIRNNPHFVQFDRIKCQLCPVTTRNTYCMAKHDKQRVSQWSALLL